MPPPFATTARRDSFTRMVDATRGLWDEVLQAGYPSEADARAYRQMCDRLFLPGFKMGRLTMSRTVRRNPDAVALFPLNEQQARNGVDATELLQNYGAWVTLPSEVYSPAEGRNLRTEMLLSEVRDRRQQLSAGWRAECVVENPFLARVHTDIQLDPGNLAYRLSTPLILVRDALLPADQDDVGLAVIHEQKHVLDLGLMGPLIFKFPGAIFAEFGAYREQVVVSEVLDLQAPDAARFATNIRGRLCDPANPLAITQAQINAIGQTDLL